MCSKWEPKPFSSGTFAGSGSCKRRQHRALGFRWWDPFLLKHPRTGHDRVEHGSFGREQVTVVTGISMSKYERTTTSFAT